MDLLRDFKFRNYSVEERLESTQEYILYKMIRDGYKTLHVCEYFPQTLASREENGRAAPLPGQEEAFAGGLQQFKTAAEEAKKLGLAELIKIDEVFEENNTCYYAYEPLEGMTLNDFLAANGGVVDYKASFQLGSPLAQSLSASFDKGVYYRAELDRILAYAGKLRLNNPFRQEYSEAYVIEDIANIYYTLITGKQYVQVLARPSQLGITLPPVLDNILYNVLFSNPAYTSIDAFYQDLKNAVDNMGPAGEAPVYEPASAPAPPAPGPAMGDSLSGTYTAPGGPIPGPGVPPTGNGPQPYHNPSMYNQPPQKSNTGKIVAGCAGIGCLGLIIIGVLLFLFTSRVFRSVTNDFDYGSFAEEWALEWDDDWDWDDEEWAWDDDDWTWDFNMYDTYAFRSTAHTGVALNDSITEDANYVYYPVWNYGWKLIKEDKATGEQMVLAEDILPAFMDIDGDTLVYADALEDYSIYSMNTDLGMPYLIHSDRSAYLNLHDGWIYFSNLEDWCSIYRTNLSGTEVEKLTYDESEYLLIMDNRLYFLNLYDNFNAYGLDFGTWEETPLNDVDSDNLIAYNNMLYYINYDTRNIEVMNAQGVAAGVYDSIEAYCFDIKDGVIYYSDYDGYGIFSYNPITGENEMLSAIQSNYVKVCGDKVYFYDYDTGELNSFTLSTGEQQSLYDGEADYTGVPGEPMAW